MTLKKRGLGRGLDALLGGNESNIKNVDNSTEQLPIDLIERGRYQPRRDFDEESLKELAASITAQGIVQPIIVRPIEHDRYEIIAGERRWRASQLAGLTSIPVVIRDVDEKSAMAMGLIENIQRMDLNAIEEAGAFHRLLNEFGLTHQQVAEAVGKSRSAVSNLLRLLDLNDEVKSLVQTHKLEMGHARALLPLATESQMTIAAQIIKSGLSVRQTEELVRKIQSETTEIKGNKAKAQQKQDPDVERLITSLSEKLGAQVKLQQGRTGKGKLVISYNSLEELDGILDHIQ
jgi:ParB family chromosome partitioning protein